MKIKGVVATEECDYCKGAKRLPGGLYKSQGEVVDCPLCNGKGTTPITITLVQLKALLKLV